MGHIGHVYDVIQAQPRAILSGMDYQPIYNIGCRLLKYSDNSTLDAAPIQLYCFNDTKGTKPSLELCYIKAEGRDMFSHLHVYVHYL